MPCLRFLQGYGTFLSVVYLCSMLKCRRIYYTIEIRHSSVQSGGSEYRFQVMVSVVGTTAALHYSTEIQLYFPLGLHRLFQGKILFSIVLKALNESGKAVPFANAHFTLPHVSVTFMCVYCRYKSIINGDTISRDRTLHRHRLASVLKAIAFKKTF